MDYEMVKLGIIVFVLCMLFGILVWKGKIKFFSNETGLSIALIGIVTLAVTLTI